MTLEISVDEDLCMGSMECVRRAPAVFEFSMTEEQARVVDPTAADERTLIQIAEDCPNCAIVVTRDGARLV